MTASGTETPPLPRRVACRPCVHIGVDDLDEEIDGHAGDIQPCRRSDLRRSGDPPNDLHGCDLPTNVNRKRTERRPDTHMFRPLGKNQFGPLLEVLDDEPAKQVQCADDALRPLLPALMREVPFLLGPLTGNQRAVA